MNLTVETSPLNGADVYITTEADIGTVDVDIPYRRPHDYFALFWQIVSPMVFVFGMFGNTMTIVICGRADVMSSMSVYFVTLASSDIVLLLVNTFCQFIDSTFGTEVASFHPFACKMTGWLGYMTGVLSAWILVAMTAQRTVCVLWPHRANILCSARKSKAIALSMILFIAVLHCHLIFGLDVVNFSQGVYTSDHIPVTFNGGTHTRNTTAVTSSVGRSTSTTTMSFSGDTHRAAVCVLAGEYAEFFFSVWSWVDLLIFSVLPWLCLVVSNSVLLWTLNVSIRQAQHSLGSAHTDRFSDRKKQASSMTVTLFAVSTAFIVLNLPISCVQVLGFYHFMAGSLDYFYQSEVISFCNEVALAMWDINSAVNFYLYCLTGSKFRRELKKTFFCSEPQSNTSAAILSSTGKNTSQ